MKPKRVSIKNYKSYGNKEYVLNLDQNAVKLIVGRSGSGKTSFIDAIIWCLYGKSLCNSDEVVNRNTKKNCKVEFEFQIDTDEYSVIRYRKHDEFGNNLVVFKNDKNISRTKVPETQQMIAEIIGISYDAMIASVIFSGELYLSFMRNTPTKRLSIFEGILSLKEINKWAEKIKEQRKPVREEVEALEDKKNKVDYGINVINSNIYNYEENVRETLENLKNERKRLEKEVEELEKEEKSISSINVEKEKERNKKYNEIVEHNEELNAEISKKKEAILGVQDKEKEIGEIAQKLQKISGIDADSKIQEIEEHNENIRHNQSIQKKIDEIRTHSITPVSKLESRLDELIATSQRLSREINSFEHDKRCPTCYQTVEADIIRSNDLVDSRKKKLEETNEEIDSLKIKIEKAKENNEKYEKQIEELEKQLVSVENKEFTYSAQELREIRDNKSSLENKKSLLEQEVSSIKQRNEELNKEISQLESKKVKLDFEPSSYTNEYLENVNTRQNEIKEEKREKQNRISTINEKAKSTYDKEYIEGLKNKRKSLRAALTKTDKKLEKQKYEEEHFAFLLKLFSNKEGAIKKDIIEKMIPIFNKDVNDYLPIFFSDDERNISVEFDTNLTETITVGKEQVSFATFSSGEKQRIDLAVAFSLFSLVKKFFSRSVSFTVFDEILDRNLDSHSLEKVLELVSTIGDDNSVLIISHNEALKEWFNNHVIVSKDKNGYSRIENYE